MDFNFNFDLEAVTDTELGEEAARGSSFGDTSCKWCWRFSQWTLFEKEFLVEKELLLALMGIFACLGHFFLISNKYNIILAQRCEMIYILNDKMACNYCTMHMKHRNIYAYTT